MARSSEYRVGRGEIEQREGQNIWLQRRQAQENGQRENTELWKRRETEEESVEERRLREMHPQVLDNVEKERQRDIQRQRREAKLRLDQIKATVQFNEVIGNRVLMKETVFKKPVGSQWKEAQDKLQEQRLKNEEEQRQRRIDIERRRRESRLALEQMKPTVAFDEAIQIREALPELGIERKEGDGF